MPAWYSWEQTIPSYTTSLTGHPLEAGKQYSIDSSLIEVDTSPIIEFADDNVKAICVENWDTNGDGELSMNEAVNIKEIGSVFQWSEIKSFNEFQFFTGVNYISNYAFSGCSSLTSIVIPENVTYIDDFIFEGCDNLTNIICLAKNPPYLFEASFAIRENWDDEGYWYDYVSCICVPLESVNAYKTAMGSYVEVLGLISTLVMVNIECYLICNKE